MKPALNPVETFEAVKRRLGVLGKSVNRHKGLEKRYTETFIGSSVTDDNWLQFSQEMTGTHPKHSTPTDDVNK